MAKSPGFGGIIWKLLEKKCHLGIDFMDLDFWCNALEGEHKQSDMRGGLLLRNRQPGW